MSKRLVILCTFVLAACGSRDEPPRPSLTGADRDAHGCIGSAGYRWCARESACVRPWELAAEKRFELSPEAVERHCSARE